MARRRGPQLEINQSGERLLWEMSDLVAVVVEFVLETEQTGKNTRPHPSESFASRPMAWPLGHTLRLVHEGS